MKKFKVKEKLKKLFILVVTLVTIGFTMPAKTEAVGGILGDFINLILHIPDGIMHIFDHFIAGSDEFTYEELNLVRRS